MWKGKYVESIDPKSLRVDIKCNFRYKVYWKKWWSDTYDMKFSALPQPFKFGLFAVAL